MSSTQRTMLVLVSADANSNKFYEVTYDPAAGTVTKRWGRVGATGQSSTKSGSDYAYREAIDAKVRRGYSVVDLAGVVSGSAPDAATLATIAKRRIVKKPSDKKLNDLVARWCATNRHHIEAVSGGNITVSDAGVMSTALGPVSLKTVQEARLILDTIAADSSAIRSIERYLTLVPQALGRKAGWEAAFADPAEIVKQRTFLDDLDGSLALAASAQTDDGVDAEFRYQLEAVGSRTKIWAEIEKRYSGSKNTIHSSSGLKLTGLYAVNADAAEGATWQSLADEHGNVRRLWHGTSEHNLISILHRGLFVPPMSGTTIQATGRMFGDGVYFSDQSTKALNYSYGYWNGRQRNSNCFMFVADVVMGHELRPTNRSQLGQSRNGKYQSISVRGGQCGVMNNEMVVWETDQIRLSYLAEFE